MPATTRRILTAVTMTASLAAQNVQGNSNAHSFTTHQTGTFGLFAANDQAVGKELWKLDLLSNTTSIVADIRPGAVGSNPTGMTFLGPDYVFAADNGATGDELWRSDGTTASLVLDINPTGSSYPREFTVVGTRVFFVANDGLTGDELWQYDGTTASLVADINPIGGSKPRSLTAFQGVLLFSADDGFSGPELWRTDGTAAGTALIADISPGPKGSLPAELTQVSATTVAFVANDGIAGAELWRTDGITAVQLADIFPGANGSAPSNLTRHLSRVYFAATSPTNGRELWVTDGATTQLFADIQPGVGGSDPRELVSDGFLDLWFTADDGPNGNEIWRSVGLTGPPIRITNLVPGTGSLEPRSLTPTGNIGEIAFVDRAFTPSLWTASAFGSTTTLQRTYRNGPVGMASHRNIFGAGLIFTADDGLGMEPYRFTVTGPQIIADIAPPPSEDRPDIDLHAAPDTLSITICMENGDPGGVGVIAVAPNISAPISLPAVIAGNVLIQPPVFTSIVLLDGTGAGCFTTNIPLPVTTAELAAQGFGLYPSTPSIRATDLGAFGVTSLSSVPMFTGDTRVVGVFNDKDHRYEIGLKLPPLPSSGRHPTGKFRVRHRKGQGAASMLTDVPGNAFDYQGYETDLFFEGSTVLEEIEGIELWFIDSEGSEQFVWRSYC
ncbi:MAG: ELWxxDGT repeat protein [Planctomycetota bacterium]